MNDSFVSMSDTRHKFALKNQIGRILWIIVYFLFFRVFSLRIFRKWRIFVLKCFGAEISWNATIHSSVKIWAPWNLAVGAFSCIGQEVDCYNQGKITIGSNTTISQKSYLCASTHDFTDANNLLILKPILIGDRVWVAADSFIGPGVMINEGAVVGARSSVFKDVEPWTVVGGNPARFLKERKITS
jgi:putative colanic acid biosynthesis acetyltransferase WcaF